MSATWVQLGVNFGQRGPTCLKLDIWEQLRPKLSSTWAQHAEHGRPNTKASQHAFSIFHLFLYWWRFMLSNVSHVVSPLGPTWCEAVAKGGQTAPCWTWLGHPRASHGFHLGSIWIDLGPTSAQHDSNLASSWANITQLGSLSGAVRAQARPNLWLTPRDTLLCKVLWLWLGFVAFKRSAQARPKLARGRPNFGQGLPSLTPVGCHLELGWLFKTFQNYVITVESF